MYPDSVPVTQHQFHNVRLWRFDFYWPKYKLAVEVQGYGPGHCSKKGMLNDADKSNSALTRGIRTVFITEHHVRNQNIQGTCKLIAYIMSKQ